MKKIMIIATPPGQAPEWVRQAWVGLEIPLSEEPACGLQMGVLGGLPENIDGFYVDGMTALSLLGEKDDHALGWWQKKAPYVLHSKLRFSRDVCELIDDEEKKPDQPVKPCGFAELLSDSARAELDAKAEELGYSAIDLGDTEIDQEAIRFVDWSIARLYHVVPLSMYPPIEILFGDTSAPDVLAIAVASDRFDQDNIDDLARLLECEIDVRLADPQQAAVYLDAFYPIKKAEPIEPASPPAENPDPRGLDEKKTLRERLICTNDQGAIYGVRWDEYFSIIEQSRDDDNAAIMTSILRDAGLLCQPKAGKHGVSIDGHRSPRDYLAGMNYCFFTYPRDAQQYLVAAEIAGLAKAGRDFVFKIDFTI